MEAIRSFKEKKENERLYRQRINLLLEEGERDLREGRVIKFNNEAEFDQFFDELDAEVTQELKDEHSSDGFL